MPPTRMLAHHRGGQKRRPTPGDTQRQHTRTHTEQKPKPEPSSDPNHIPTRLPAYEHRRADGWTALLFLCTPKPKELQQLRALSAPKCHRHHRFCEMALLIICLSAVTGVSKLSNQNPDAVTSPPDFPDELSQNMLNYSAKPR